MLAIANIAFSAVAAMAAREARRIGIDVSTQAGYACINIRDTGPGLMPAQLARLFEPFHTTKPRGKGLGLGLALRVKSVASMNGRIEADNHPHGGAVFSVWLPMAGMPQARRWGGWRDGGAVIAGQSRWDAI